MNQAQTENKPGEEGVCAPGSTECSINLCKPSDVAMVLRSIANKWEPSPQIRQAICDQIPGALDYYNSKVGGEGASHKRAAQRMIALARCLLAMDCDNLLADHPSLAKSLREHEAMPRRRNPDRRRGPRGMRR